MPTLSEMIDEVKSNLIGYTLRQDRLTYLTNSGGITTTSSSITVGSAENLARGIIEIDDELIWIDSFNKNSSTMNVAPGFGRGYMGTTPAPHALNAMVTLSPSFPRISIKRLLTTPSTPTTPRCGE